jgi:large subunit ribosomal protein LP0
MAMNANRIRKHKYRQQLEGLLEEYQNIIIISVDNVGSNHLQQVRIALRGRAVMLMGKNTVMRKVLREAAEKNPRLTELPNYLRGNVGFVFTNDNLLEIRDVLVEIQVPAAAKAGAIAPVDVFIPAGPTSLDPGQTGFFQALNIATKIVRGAIEINSRVHLIKKSEKVSASAVSLLAKLNIKPFFYGINVVCVYENGSIYGSEILDMTDDLLLSKFFNGVSMIAKLSLKIGFPTVASLPHSIARAFKKMVAISVATDYEFEESKIFKEMIANPDAFKSAEAAPAAEEEAAAAAAPEPDSEEEEEEGGGGLFGDDDDDY